jgi:TetR/AcrR family fatty acid metabolism transcriptional regulator
MADEKRRAILDAGLRVFAKNGFASARISDIAAAAGVGKGTVYLYFDSKEDLLLGVLESYVDDVLSMIDELALSGVEAEEGIRVFFETALGLVAANLDLLSIIEQRLFLSDAGLRARGETFFRSMIERLVSTLSSNMKNDIVIAYDLEILATVVIGALSSFRLYHVLHPEETQDASLAKVSAELSRFFAAALLPPQG